MGVCRRATGARVGVLSPPDCPLTKPESHIDAQTIGCTVREDRRVGCDVTA